jgi:hypothetical protein
MLERGVFRNPGKGRFPVGYGARPDEIAPFFLRHGFSSIGLHAVESVAAGIAHGLPELENSDASAHKTVIDLLLRVSSEASLLGFYGHLLYIGRKKEPI